MYRLNERAWKILRAEVQRCSSNDQVSKIEQEIVIKRLEKLRSEKDSPIKLEELRDKVIDTYPQFSQKVLKQAAQANQPSGVFTKIKWATILLGSSAGVLWVVNLPYPMIRWPIAKTAPILLLPSYISMDYHYRGAIHDLEQADQLVNKATSPANIQRGGEKVKSAQKHLHYLPVWFLGYYPHSYCNLFGCTWKFTLDEFETARLQAARIDAIVFQDQNDFTPLAEAEQVLKVAKQQYEQANNTKDREKAISSWQTALDQFDKIPEATLAGETAQTKLKAYRPDFDNARNGTLIIAAQEFDLEAEKIKQTQPKAASELWEQAINSLNQISTENPRYLEAQKLLAGYQVKLKIVVEPPSDTYITLIIAAQEFDLEAEKIKQTQPQAASDLWEQAINRLNQIPRKNPQYLEAQKLLAVYQVKLRTVVEPRSDTYIEAAKQFALAAANASQNPPHPKEKWEQIEKLWQKSIDQLEHIRVEEPGYVTAQKLLAEYQTNLGIIETRRKAETAALATFKEANEQIQRLIASPPADPQRLKAEIQGIINQLKTIKAGTTVYAEAQRLLLSAQKRLQQ